MRDVFIFVNDGLEYFSCDIIRSIPHLSFDLRQRSHQLQEAEVNELIYYLTSRHRRFVIHCLFTLLVLVRHEHPLHDLHEHVRQSTSPRYQSRTMYQHWHGRCCCICIQLRQTDHTTAQ